MRCPRSTGSSTSSPDLRERQRATIARRARGPRRACRVDRRAAAAHRRRRADERSARRHSAARDRAPRTGEWFERGVTWRDTAWRWTIGRCRDDALRVTRRANDSRRRATTRARSIPAAEALIAAVGAAHDRRRAAGLDYGFPQAEYYTPQRREGTLMAHYRHRALTDPFVWPGLSDLTAHVDFTAIALAGERGGLRWRATRRRRRSS